MPSKAVLEEDMLVVVNEDGDVLEGFLNPTSEMKLHLECYKLRPDITSVVHAHSPYATAFALANKSKKRFKKLLDITREHSKENIGFSNYGGVEECGKKRCLFRLFIRSCC